MPVKKCVLMLCVLLALVSPAAAFVQGDEQFFFSSDMLEEVNPNLGDDANPSYRYTSVSDPGIVLNDISTVFPSRLAGMSFVASYAPEGKTAVYPGFLTLQFTESEILALPKGQAIMSEIRASQSLDVLLKYFDPVFVVYGADGNKISINVKNYPFNFNFTPGDYRVMSFSFPVVFADGYPETFCIEMIGRYAAVYDAVVSETNSGKIGDGKIEVSFALVPNEKALGAAVSDYPVLEPYGSKGYVVFDDCSKYLGSAEMSGVFSARIESGNTAFSRLDGGFSFESPYSNFPGKGSSLVTAYIKASEAPDVFTVNGYSLPFKTTALPDGSVYAYSSFVLVDGSFVSDILMSGDMPVVFDGSNNGVLTASVSAKKAASASFFYHGRGSFEVIPKEGFSGLSSGGFTQAVLPLIDGIASQISPVRFEGTVGQGKSVYGTYEFVIRRDDFPSLKVQSLSEIFDIVRPVLFAGDVGFDLYDYLTVNGKADLLSLSGSLQAGISVKVPVVLSDREPAGVSLGSDYISISDGRTDGSVVLSSYIGTLKKSENKETHLLSSSTLSLKKANIDISSLYDGEEAEADFDWTGQTDWPGKEGVLDAVSVGSFVGTYDGSGKYSSLKVEVSVSASDLKKLSADRYKKVCASWTEDRTKFLDYYHVYKQIGSSVYDLVLLGGKSAFTVAGDPTSKVVVSFNAALIDDVGTPVFDDGLQCFIIYDGAKDGNLIDPLFIGTPESVPEDASETPEEKDEEKETKHILPDNPAGSSSGHDDLGKWISIISIF